MTGSIGDQIATIVSTTPELGQTPGLALGAAQATVGGTPQDAAQMGQFTSVTAQYVATQRALESIAQGQEVQATKGNSVLRTLARNKRTGLEETKDFWDRLGDASHFLTKPLEEMQHVYRYLRAVQQYHGTDALLGLITVPALIGVAAGVASRSANVGALATEISLMAEGRMAYQDVWDATEHRFVDETGESVTFGRDVAHLIGAADRNKAANLITATNPVATALSLTAGRDWDENPQNDPAKQDDVYKYTTGASDAIFDLIIDPLSIVGKGLQVAKAKGVFLGSKEIMPGTNATVEQLGNVDRTLYVASKRPDVARALDTWAEMDSGQIVAHFPKYAPMAKELGAAKSRTQVAEVLRDMATSENFHFAADGLPRTGLTRQKLFRPINQKIYESRWASNPDGSLKRLGKAWNLPQSYRPFAIDSETLEMSAKKFRYLDPASYKGVERALRFSQNPRTVSKIMKSYIDGPSGLDKLDDGTRQAVLEAHRYSVYKQGVLDMFRAAGLRDDNPYMKNVTEAIEAYGPGKRGAYALDSEWNDISHVKVRARYGDGKVVGADAEGIDASKLTNNKKALVALERAGKTDALDAKTAGAAEMSIPAAMWEWQTGTGVFPDFVALRDEIRRSKGKFWAVMGAADHGLASFYTNRFFKPLALLTGGFAMRVSIAELWPAYHELGAKNLGGGALSSLANGVRKSSGQKKLKAVLADRMSSRRSELMKRPEASLDHDQLLDLVDEPGATVVFDPVSLARDEKGFVVRPYAERYADIDAMDLNNDTINKFAYDNSDLLQNPDSRIMVRRSAEDPSQVTLAIGRTHKKIDDALKASMHLKGAAFFDIMNGSEHAVPREAMESFAKGAVSPRLGKKGLEFKPVKGEHKALADDDSPGITQAAEELAAEARQFGVKMDATEAKHYMASWLDTLWTGSRKIPGRTPAGVMDEVDDDFADVSRWLIVRRQNGGLVPGAVDPGSHGGGTYLTDNPDHRWRAAIMHSGQKVERGKRATGGFAMYHVNNDTHPRMWAHQLNKLSKESQHAQVLAHHWHPTIGHSNDDEAVAAAVAWKAAHPEVGANLVRNMLDPEKHTRDQLEALKGLTIGRDGTVHHDLIEKIARGETIDADELVAKMDAGADSMPSMVLGPNLEPVGHIAKFDQLIQAGFHKVLDPIIVHMAREPIYVGFVTREYKAFKKMIDEGMISRDEALRVAETRAVNQMVPIIHNTLLRNQLSDVLRNVFPFYFAQEQAWRRFGNVATKNPAAWARYNLLHYAMTDAAVERSDEEGNSYFAYPWTGKPAEWLSLGLNKLGLPVQAGIPLQFSGGVASLHTTMPEAQFPSTSPVVAVAGKAIMKIFPESEDLIEPVIGEIATGSSNWDLIIPNNAVHSLMNVARSGGGGTASFNSSVAYSIAEATRQAESLRMKADEAYAKGNRNRGDELMAQAAKVFPDQNSDSMVQQKAIEKIKNTTRIYFVAKALLGAVVPMSPKMEVGHPELRDELKEEIKAAGGEWSVGIDKFLKKHPDATSYTIFQTEAANGTLPQATNKVGQWLMENNAWVRKNTLSAPYLMPADPGDYDPAVFNRELAMGLRNRRTPEEFLKAIYVAQGGSEYYRDQDTYQKLRAAAEQAGDKSQVDYLQQAWSTYQKQFFAFNPIFAENLKSAEREINALSSYQQLVATIADGSAPQGPQTEAVKGILTDYAAYQKFLQQAELSGNPEQKALVKQAWDEYLGRQGEADPRLYGVINNVVRRLPDPVMQPGE